MAAGNLPMTGGSGHGMIWLAGGLMMLLAALAGGFMAVTGRRRRILARSQGSYGDWTI